MGFEAARCTGGEFPLSPGSVQTAGIRESTNRADRRWLLGEGYASDITRTFVLGKASDKMKTGFRHRASSPDLPRWQREARSGAGSVDAARGKVITTRLRSRLPNTSRIAWDTAMGMDGHEWPYLVRGNSTKLRPEMTFSDEPGIYIRGEFGIRLKTTCTSQKTEQNMFIRKARPWKPVRDGVEPMFGTMFRTRSKLRTYCLTGML